MPDLQPRGQREEVLAYSVIQTPIFRLVLSASDDYFPSQTNYESPFNV